MKSTKLYPRTFFNVLLAAIFLLNWSYTNAQALDALKHGKQMHNHRSTALQHNNTMQAQTDPAGKAAHMAAAVNKSSVIQQSGKSLNSKSIVEQKPLNYGSQTNLRTLTPVNDDCANAIAINCGDSITGNTVGATPDTTSCASYASGGVWYSFTPDSNCLVTASLCGSSYDTYMSAYSGTCGALTCISYNDDFCSTFSQITFLAAASETYYILVNGYSNYSGDFVLKVTCATLNDNCALAIPVDCGSSVYGNTTLASAQYTDCSTYSSPGLWYSVTPTSSGIVTASLCGSSFDTYMSAYSGTCSALVCITQNDDYCGLQSQVSFPVTGGTTYYILVNGYSLATGDFILNVTCGPPPPANDDCSGVTPVTLTSGVPQTFTGTTVSATSDGSVITYPSVWHAITLTSCATVTINYCDNNPELGSVWAVIARDCPATDFIYTTDYVPCDSNFNWVVNFNDVPAGTYWIPVMSLAPQDYTLTVTAIACPPPVNDSCSSVTPDTLNMGEPETFTGTTVGATTDGDFWAPTVWHAITLTGCANLTLDYCANEPVLNDVWVILSRDCSFSNTIYANSWSQDCGEGNNNWMVTYNNLPAGTYYIPVMGEDPGYNIAGPYTLTVTAAPCPPVNDNCSDVTPVALTYGVPQTFTGTTIGATEDGPDFWMPTVWHAITLSDCSNLTVDYCATRPAFNLVWSQLVTDCPPTTFIYPDSSRYACGPDNDNQVLYYHNLPAGTYYIPVLGVDWQSYSLTVTAQSCVTICNGFHTEGIGGWGSKPKGQNPGQYLKNHFASAFTSPNYLTIGCTNKLKLTTWQAVQNYLPCGGTPAVLPAGTLTNPTCSRGNTFAGQVIALTLNIRFDQLDASFSANSTYHLGDLIVNSGLFQGWTVYAILAEANRLIGGCSSSYTVSQMNNVLDMINSNYAGGLVNNGHLNCPSAGRPEQVEAVNSPAIAFPNPAGDAITVQFNTSSTQPYIIRLFDLTGKSLIHVNGNSAAGVNDCKLNLENLVRGIYIIEVAYGNRLDRIRIVLQ